MRSLLYLVHRLPYPPNKGDKVRSYHLLRHLAKRHRVFLGTFVDDPDDLRHVDVVRDGRRFEVNLESGLSGSATGRITLISNDLVVVPTKRGFSRADVGIAFSAITTVLAIVNIAVSLRRK